MTLPVEAFASVTRH